MILLKHEHNLIGYNFLWFYSLLVQVLPFWVLFLPTWDWCLFCHLFLNVSVPQGSCKAVIFSLYLFSLGIRFYSCVFSKHPYHKCLTWLCVHLLFSIYLPFHFSNYLIFFHLAIPNVVKLRMSKWNSHFEHFLLNFITLSPGAQIRKFKSSSNLLSTFISHPQKTTKSYSSSQVNISTIIRFDHFPLP